MFGESGAKQIFQKIKNMHDWYQTQKSGGATDDVFKLRQSIKDLADAQDIEPFARGIVGVGYSGGFAPLVHALSNGEFIPKSFVALGGATWAIGTKLAEFIVNVVEMFENYLTVRDDTLRGLTQAAVGVLAAFLKGPMGLAADAANNLLTLLDAWYGAVDKQALDAMVADFYKDLRLRIEPQLGYNWNNLAASNAGLVVNIYGSKDPLTYGNAISGYLEELGGYKADTTNDPLAKPLFNIEIEGANHYDYIKGVKQYSNEADRTRNDVVSAYVARLILNAQDPDTLKKYLEELKSLGFAELIETGYWKLHVL